jgi:hypothetical protein
MKRWLLPWRSGFARCTRVRARPDGSGTEMGPSPNRKILYGEKRVRSAITRHLGSCSPSPMLTYVTVCSAWERLRLALPVSSVIVRSPNKCTCVTPGRKSRSRLALVR